MQVHCALYVEVTEEADLPALDWDSLPQPVLVMGGGSNLLFTRDFPGTVVHVAAGITAFGGTPFATLSPAPPTASAAGPSPYPCAGVHMSSEGSDTCLVTLSAGVVFDDFCAWAASEGLWGPENLSLIPGEVGASAVQNIGAYGVEAKEPSTRPPAPTATVPPSSRPSGKAATSSPPSPTASVAPPSLAWTTAASAKPWKRAGKCLLRGTPLRFAPFRPLPFPPGTGPSPYPCAGVHMSPEQALSRSRLATSAKPSSASGGKNCRPWRNWAAQAASSATPSSPASISGA